MGWREALAGRFFEDIVSSRVQEAVKVIDDKYWREISKAAGPKDISWYDLVEQGRDSLAAYRVNPLAFRIVELSKDYVLGRGVKIGSEIPAVDDWTKAWWSHPQNRMDLRLRQWVTELSLSGEILVTLHTNEMDGISYVRAVPASAIDEIETDAEDYERELSYHQVLEEDIGGQGRTWPAPGESSAGEASMLHYAVNRVVGMVRGQGDLAPILPWLTRYKDWLTDRVRINRYKGAYLWDVTLEGAQESDILARQAQLASPPNPGSVLVHGEGETWKAVSPEIRAEDAEPDGKAIRLMIAAGGGIPLHFLSEGESATKATASEMGEPTRRAYEDRQKYVGWMINDLLGTAIERAAASGASKIPAGARESLKPVVFPDLTTADNSALAQAAKDIVAALTEAQLAGYIEKEQAAEVFRLFAGLVTEDI
jgi:hypothetical protein